MKSLFPKPLTSTPTCYSFEAQVTAKKPIFNTKFTANGKCWYFLKFGIENINKFKFQNCKNCFPALSYNIFIYKEKQRNKVLFGSKTSSIQYCMSLISTFNHFVHIMEYVQMKVIHNRNIFHETWTILTAKGSQSIMQMSNMSEWM